MKPKRGLKLIDGHLRQSLDPDQEIPVLVLDVTPKEADKLLATLDPLAAMAETNREAAASLLQSIDCNNAELSSLLADIGRRTRAVMETIEKPAAGGNPAAALPAANIRMVQLFFNESSIEEFRELASALAKQLGTENTTDTVIAAMRYANDSA